MKRYASHLLFLPRYGYIRQHVVELENGCVRHIFPFTHEVEDTQWMPGIMIILPTLDIEQEIRKELLLKKIDVLSLPVVEACCGQYLCWCFPFDFSKMQFFAETRHTRLL